MWRIVGRTPGGGHRRQDLSAIRKTRSRATMPPRSLAFLGRPAPESAKRYGQAPSATHPAASGVVGAAYMPPCEPEGEIYSPLRRAGAGGVQETRGGPR